MKKAKKISTTPSTRKKTEPKLKPSTVIQVLSSFYVKADRMLQEMVTLCNKEENV